MAKNSGLTRNGKPIKMATKMPSKPEAIGGSKAFMKEHGVEGSRKPRRHIASNSHTKVNQGGRSSRAYSSKGYSLDSNLDLRDDYDFGKHSSDLVGARFHESMQNSADRRHDEKIEKLHTGVVDLGLGPGFDNVPLEQVSPLAALGNLFSKITNGAGQAISGVSNAIGNFFSTRTVERANVAKHNSSLKVANKMDKRKHRSFFFGNLFNAASERRRHKASVKQIKVQGKQHRRNVAMQRGYW